MLKDVQLHLVETYEDVTACLAWLDQTDTTHLGFDTESTGLSPELDSTRLVQFGDAFHGWAFELFRWFGLAEEIVKRWLRRARRFVAHNARFDVAFLRKHGIHIPVHLVDDTMMVAHIANPTVSIGLKQQSGRHVDPRAAAMQSQLDAVMHSGKWSWATIPVVPEGPVSAYWVYAALDPVLTVRLWLFHAPSVLAEAPRAYDLELAIGWVADRMERKGVLVDAEFTQAKEAEFAELHRDLTQRAKDEFDVDAGSKDQIVHVLVRDGVDLWKRTDTGAFSLDKEVLPHLDHPLAKIIAHRRKVEKLHSTYLRRFIEYSAFDGRLHPNINTLGFSEQTGGEFGVVTSRMSMSKPNLQQLPRGGDPLASVIRNCIVAKEGHTFVMCDFDQIELRIMAHLSGDPALIEAFKAGGDFFTILTRRIYKDDTITKSDPRRQLTKAYVYATLYGAGNDKLATTTGVPLAEVEKLAADFSAAYPRVTEFQREVQNRAKDRLRAEGIAYVRSPLTGRKLIGEENQEYKLVNYLIQSMAAEIMKTKALELNAAELEDGTSLGDFMVLFVHDEVILEVPDEDVDEVCEVLNGIMNDDKLLTVPMTAGLATGKRWGEKRDYDLAA